MTREEAKEYLPIMQAYSEGKVIQAKLITDGKWVDIDDDEELTLSCPPSDYRIKPESKYRPFKTQEECWEEMLKHEPFGWVKGKCHQEVILIGRIFMLNGDLTLTWSSNEGYDMSSSDVFSDYTFTDGEPFGIKDE